MRVVARQLLFDGLREGNILANGRNPDERLLADLGIGNEHDVAPAYTSEAVSLVADGLELDAERFAVFGDVDGEESRVR